MPKTAKIDRLLPLFREYMQLENKRVGQGVTPLEFQRWLDVKKTLGKHFQAGPDRERRSSERVETRIRVAFKSEELFRQAAIRNLSRGGVFIATPFAAEVGTELVLRIHIQSSSVDLEVPGVVASNNVSDGHSTGVLGMGVRFGNLSEEQKSALDAVYRQVAEDAPELGDAPPAPLKQRSQ
jgi:uncharacterized protein (TIGR02266 family)